MVDLRDVVDGCDAVVELAEPSGQLVDVDVLRAEHGREFEQDVFVVSDGPGRCARAVVDQYAVGEEAA
jgi:hypothetical protein